jgi:hypothetical protein
MNSCLTSIELPASVKVIDASAFRGVELSSVAISEGDSLYRIHQSFLQDISSRSIFRYFGNANEVVIPSFVTVLCKASFALCKSLTSVVFENDSQLEQIGELAFSETGLTTICIPMSVAKIHNTAFLKCESLKTVTFQSGSKDEVIATFDRESRQHILVHRDPSGFAEFKIEICAEKKRTRIEWSSDGPYLVEESDPGSDTDSSRDDDSDFELGPFSSDDWWDL